MLPRARSKDKNLLQDYNPWPHGYQFGALTPLSYRETLSICDAHFGTAWIRSAEIVVCDTSLSFIHRAAILLSFIYHKFDEENWTKYGFISKRCFFGQTNMKFPGSHGNVKHDRRKIVKSKFSHPNSSCTTKLYRASCYCASLFSIKVYPIWIS